MVFRQRNRHASNLSSTVLIGQFWAPKNNFNVIDLTPKLTPFEACDKINKVVLDKIIENMDSLAHSGMYDAINIYDTTINVFYVIQFLSKVYTLKKN